MEHCAHIQVVTAPTGVSCMDCGAVVQSVSLSPEVEMDQSTLAVLNAGAGAAVSSALSQPYGVETDVDVQMGMDCSECFLTMLETEENNRAYEPSNRMLKYRRLLVDWLAEVAEETRLHKSTAHVAAMYLDRVVQAVGVSKTRLQLVAICCLLVAAKYEEKEESVPPIADLNAYANHKYDSDMIQQVEMVVLEKLEWRLTAVTPLHVVEYWEARGVVYVDDTIGGRPLVQKVPRYVAKYCSFFADLGLQAYPFQRFRPSVLAGAIVAAARRALDISPVWRPELESLTGLPFAGIEEAYTELWGFYEENFPKAAANGAREASPTSAAEL